jgi:hypothetical protein
VYDSQGDDDDDDDNDDDNDDEPTTQDKHARRHYHTRPRGTHATHTVSRCLALHSAPTTATRHRITMTNKSSSGESGAGFDTDKRRLPPTGGQPPLCYSWRGRIERPIQSNWRPSFKLRTCARRCKGARLATRVQSGECGSTIATESKAMRQEQETNVEATSCVTEKKRGNSKGHRQRGADKASRRITRLQRRAQSAGQRTHDTHSNAHAHTPKPRVNKTRTMNSKDRCRKTDEAEA